MVPNGVTQRFINDNYEGTRVISIVTIHFSIEVFVLCDDLINTQGIDIRSHHRRLQPQRHPPHGPDGDKVPRRVSDRRGFFRDFFFSVGTVILSLIT